MFGRLSTGVAAVVLLALASGCTAGICDRPESAEPTPFTGGDVIGDMYRTSAFDGDLLHFPGGAYYKIHHGLGEVPIDVRFFLSFARDGDGSATVSQAAGNQVEMTERNAETLTVLNGSCADYFLIVHAYRGPTGTGGAGGS